MDTLAISPANLDIIEQNLHVLANNMTDVYQSVNNVTGHVNEIDNKVTSVTDTVKTLEEEIKSFMLEIREHSIVGNARQTILMDENELNKKFGHYDEIRRRINGILQSTDINAIKKSTIENISEESLINTPNYYLAPALVALCAWILNNKELAYKSLKEAMVRDDEKTSLLFCLINLRVGRVSSSIKWLNRYLDMQDPTKMDGKIITILDAVTSGVFGPVAKEICINKISMWLKEINNLNEYKEKQKERFVKYFRENKKELKDDLFPYIHHYSTDYEYLKDTLSISYSYNTIYNKLKDITNVESKGNDENKIKIDNLLNLLVFSYEKEELELRKDIDKNKQIIYYNGDVKKALKKFENTSKIYKEQNDILTHLTNIVLEHKTINPNIETRKYALALEKPIIKDAFDEISNNTNVLSDIKISINEWQATTKDGSNEKELKKSLDNYVEKLFEKELNDTNYFNLRMFISIIIGLITMFLSKNSPVMTLLIFIVTLSYNAYEVFITYKKRTNIFIKIKKNQKSASDILTNIIAEIVDYSFIYKNNLKNKERFISFIDSLNPNEYIKSTINERNITLNKGV